MNENKCKTKIYTMFENTLWYTNNEVNEEIMQNGKEQDESKCT